ncbi:M15 family metallopeptidase [Serpentinicella alkaliphila]|uniref:D-alanyl-D-alanine carboxypeptidase-like protein n=1 Tax=Serpentinicella alkaliphila TaxID=1734049 RepID=A0A4R2UA50_9FIRM|nr:M15 family metallopeptidase [Serpentinicella alkaliphila]QUH25247.1 M15 family metallopeptidase [Serpentinicella alkaliphila]TCQ07059.1 D-alanyl-D-alanine carboxypeptidase-like protein [Serpentinicella alkaliphila]
MKTFKKYTFFLLVIFGVFSVLTVHYIIGRTEKTSVNSTYDYETTLKQDIFSLMLAYPEYIIDLEVVDSSKVYLILKSGEKILYDDGKEKTHEQKLSNPDIKDMLEQRYVIGAINKLMPEDYNPGRIRVYPLLNVVYGGTQHLIEKNLVGVQINLNYHRFNSNNNASDYLKAAITELNALAKEKPLLWSYIYPLGGTYNYRYISKTNRLSPHAFGLAIDLASNKDDYWQWASRAAGEKRLKGYPQEIVDIMEKNYFIWGGKWGQFDILHFEYRPEIIMKALYFTNEGKDVWFEKLPVDNKDISELVCFIEERLENFISPH